MDDVRPATIEPIKRDKASEVAAIRAALAAHQVSEDDPAFLVLKALEYTLRCTEEIPTRIEAAANAQVLAVEASATAAATKAALIANNAGTALVAEIKQTAAVHQQASKSIVKLITQAAEAAATKAGHDFTQRNLEVGIWAYKKARRDLLLESYTRFFAGFGTAGVCLLLTAGASYTIGQYTVGADNRSMSMVDQFVYAPMWLAIVPLAIASAGTAIVNYFSKTV